MHSRRLAICSWSLRPSDPAELVDLVHKCGLEAVQLALVPVVEDPVWSDVTSTLRSENIEIVSGMLATVGEDYSSLASIAQTGGVRPDSTWAATWELAQKVAERAASLQVSLVTLHAGFLPDEPCDERSKMLDRLHQLGDIFQSMMIDIALETGQETAETLVGVLEELSHPSVGVNFDPANMILYGKGDPVSSMRTLAPWVRQVHIKDAIASEVRGNWGTEVPVGDGAVQWESFLKAVPDGIDLVIEREAGEQREGDIKGAVSLLQECGAC